ncbi:MAG: hypothetical protein M3Z46_02585, partial [Actinomycetota bacterium]|nr:hypothetical protein [Actinomycetota bacterium]
LYVIHLSIFTAIEQNHLFRVRAVSMVAEVSLSLVAAALSFRFIEAPALRLKRRLGGSAV